MSDLVGRLAARAAGARPGSRPRPRPRFSAGADLTEVTEDVAAPPPPAAQAPVRPVPPPGEPPPVVVREAPPAHHTTVVHRREPAPPATPGPPPPPSHTVVRQSFPRTEVRVVREPTPPAHPRPDVPPTAPSPVVVEKSDHTRTVVDRTRERITHEVERSTVSKRHTVLTRVTEPRRPAAAPAATPPQALPPLRPPERQEEAVRISIGRVEIRANLVAPDPVRHTPRPAADTTISLADYLRGGHR